MDIVAWSPMYGEFLLDVTVRHPLTFSYQPQASQIDGIANDMANLDKQARYPPQGGRAVVTASTETWGRLGTQLQTWLSTLASAARERDRARGLSASRYLPRWRLLLTSAVQKAVYKIIQDAIVPDMASKASL